MSFTAAQASSFDAVVTGLIAEWQKIKPQATLLLNPDNLAKAFKFFQTGLEQLVNLAAQINLAGADKKALVTGAADKLFNAVVVALLPTWAKPFTSLINTLFDGMISGVIEYLVTKLPVQKAA